MLDRPPSSATGSCSSGRGYRSTVSQDVEDAGGSVGQCLGRRAVVRARRERRVPGQRILVADTTQRDGRESARQRCEIVPVHEQQQRLDAAPIADLAEAPRGGRQVHEGLVSLELPTELLDERVIAEQTERAHTLHLQRGPAI